PSSTHKLADLNARPPCKYALALTNHTALEICLRGLLFSPHEKPLAPKTTHSPHTRHKPAKMRQHQGYALACLRTARWSPRPIKAHTQYTNGQPPNPHQKP